MSRTVDAGDQRWKLGYEYSCWHYWVTDSNPRNLYSKYVWFYDKWLFAFPKNIQIAALLELYVGKPHIGFNWSCQNRK